MTKKAPKLTAEQTTALNSLKAAQARQMEHMRVAVVSGKSAQSQVVSKVTDSGELSWKLQGMRTDGVRSRAERSENANNTFAIVNAQNRQFEAMSKYLWSVKRGDNVAILAALAPMAQGHETVHAAMPASAWTKAVKRAEFEGMVSEAMRATIWAK